MPEWIDQLGRSVTVSDNPQRIVSLVPSQTEFFADLGLDKEIVGLTRFCVHPDDWRFRKTRVGGTKDFKLDRIRSLTPDLIIANKEENDEALINELSQEFPVWISDVRDLESAYSMMLDLGGLLGRTRASISITSQIAESFEQLRKKNQDKPRRRVLYLIWKKPYMTVGGDTFISALLEEAGFQNVLMNKVRYPEVDWKEVRDLGVDRVFLSSEPYPFKERDILEIKAILPEADIRLVDGELFSWYGSRLLKSVDYFIRL